WLRNFVGKLSITEYAVHGHTAEAGRVRVPERGGDGSRGAGARNHDAAGRQLRLDAGAASAARVAARGPAAARRAPDAGSAAAAAQIRPVRAHADGADGVRLPSLHGPPVLRLDFDHRLLGRLHRVGLLRVEAAGSRE